MLRYRDYVNLSNFKMSSSFHNIFLKSIPSKPEPLLLLAFRRMTWVYYKCQKKSI